MKGSPIRGAVSGLLFGLFLGLFVLTFGLVATDSILLVVLPVLFLVVGIALGVVAPFKRDRLQRPAHTPTAP
jgi:hypothetical protein